MSLTAAEARTMRARNRTEWENRMPSGAYLGRAYDPRRWDEMLPDAVFVSIPDGYAEMTRARAAAVEQE